MLRRIRAPRHQLCEFSHGEANITRRVKVYWQDDHEWYCGSIDQYDGNTHYHITYDDGEEEWIVLPSVDVCFEDAGKETQSEAV